MMEEQTPTACPSDVITPPGHMEVVGDGVRRDMQINETTSPELAIKIAYDFGRNLRARGAEPDVYDQLESECVDQPYSGNPLLKYIRAGFKAGFNYEGLPWRRQIDAPN